MFKLTNKKTGETAIFATMEEAEFERKANIILHNMRGDYRDSKRNYIIEELKGE